MIFGSNEDLQKLEPTVNVAEIEELERTLQFAKYIFTEKEWSEFSNLMQENAHYVKKATSVAEGVKVQNFNLLSVEERAKFEEIQKQLLPYLNQLNDNRVVPIQTAQAVATFPISFPTYIPEGYLLEEEGVELEAH